MQLMAPDPLSVEYETDHSRVLIIDDEIDVCHFLKENLEEEELQIDYQCSAHEALALIESSQSYSLFLIDLKLGQANGLELIKRIKEIREGSIFIIMTAYPDLTSTLWAIKEDVFSFIIKPFSLEEVILAVRNGLEKFNLLKYNRILMEKLTQTNGELVEATLNLEKANALLGTKVLDREEELVNAYHALEDRKAVEIAKGIVMKMYRMDEDEAMKRLQKLSRSRRCKLAELARSIIEAEKSGLLKSVKDSLHTFN
jgi:AmiR/NasT family two-component response regulator